MLMMLPGLEGEERSRELSQWYSPQPLADKLWPWATRGRSVARVLEPSAGHGALLRPALRDSRVRRVTAVDIDPRNTEYLRGIGGGKRLSIVRGDFLSFKQRDRFDIAVINPPYENDLDVAFINHALGFAPIVVGIFRSALVHGSDPAHGGRWEKLWRHVDLTRLAWLRNRPKFGEGTGAQSDFIVAEFQRRAGAPRLPGEASSCQVEWW